jgi:hypothetical protein
MLQSRGADPRIESHVVDPYLDPVKKLPLDMAVEDDQVRSTHRMFVL